MDSRKSNTTRQKLPAFLSIFLILAACAAAPTKSTVIRSIHDLPPGHRGFNDMLIISVAGDYESRALMETSLASDLSDSSGEAAAYFTVVGRRPLLNRTKLETTILSRGFDSVLLIRQKGQEQEGLVANRPVGQKFDLFGYDYDELNYAASIEQAPAITFVTELYSTADNKKIWSIDTISFDKASATELINEQSATIAEQLRTDDILAR